MMYATGGGNFQHGEAKCTLHVNLFSFTNIFIFLRVYFEAKSPLPDDWQAHTPALFRTDPLVKIHASMLLSQPTSLFVLSLALVHVVPKLHTPAAAIATEDAATIHFTFDLYVDNICADGIDPSGASSDVSLTPDTKARVEEGCLNWVQELTDLAADDILDRNERRPEDQGSDDFVELFTTPDLTVDTMVVTSFEDGTTCEDITVVTDGDYRHRQIQRKKRSSVARVSSKGCQGPCICRQCLATDDSNAKGNATLRALLSTVLGSVDGDNGRTLQGSGTGTGNLTESLLNVGFADVANVSFRNFRILDCNPVSLECRGEETDAYACCGANGCKCKYTSETLCASEACYIDDSLCCALNPYEEDGDVLLYPDCAESDACRVTDGDLRQSSTSSATSITTMRVNFLFVFVFGFLSVSQ